MLFMTVKLISEHILVWINQYTLISLVLHWVCRLVTFSFAHFWSRNRSKTWLSSSSAPPVTTPRSSTRWPSWPSSRDTTTSSPSTRLPRDYRGGRDRDEDNTTKEWIYEESPNSDLHVCMVGSWGKSWLPMRRWSASRISQGRWSGLYLSSEE